jgi:hypothetical protein
MENMLGFHGLVRSISKEAFNWLMLGLLVLIVSMFMNGISRGPVHSFTSENCGTHRRLESPLKGVPCTGLRQDFGWPVHVRSDFTEIKSMTGAYIPPKFSECYHSCGRGYWPLNMMALGGVVLAI